MYWVIEIGIYGMGMVVGSCRYEVILFIKKVIFVYIKLGISRDFFNVLYMCKLLYVVIIVILIFFLLLFLGEVLGVLFYKLRN